MKDSAAKTTAAGRLATAIIDFDEDNPGDPASTVEVPADVWAAWIDMAGDIIAEQESVNR